MEKVTVVELLPKLTRKATDNLIDASILDFLNRFDDCFICPTCGEMYWSSGETCYACGSDVVLVGLE